MEIKTNRLTLRPWCESDAEVLYEYASDPEVGYPAGWCAHKSVEESREVIRTVFSLPETYAICLKKDGKPIGCIGFHRNDLAEADDEYELGYWVGKPFWGQGIVTEAAEALLRRAFFDLGMARIWCGYYDENVRSRRVQEKLGFVYQRTTEGVEVPSFGEVRTGHVLLLTHEEWQKNQKLGVRIERRAKQLKNDVPAVFLALQDKKTPWYAKLFAALTVAYALSPIDLVPDFIPILGYLDDLIILPMLVALTVRFIPKDVFAKYRERAREMWADGKPERWYFALPIILLWVLLLALVVLAILF